jgi:hypothetical protein
MRNRLHEPRSDPPSPRRLNDVNVNKSLYGNKRETPSIRCRESSRRPRTASRTAYRQNPCSWRPCAGIGAPGSVRRGSVRRGSVRRGSVRRGSVRRETPVRQLTTFGSQIRPPRPVGKDASSRRTGGRTLPDATVARDLGIVPESTGRASRTAPGLAGHVRLAGNVPHRNPSASDIHPRNRTPVGNVSLATDDAIQGHRTGPGAIPRNKEGKDGC